MDKVSLVITKNTLERITFSEKNLDQDQFARLEVTIARKETHVK